MCMCVYMCVWWCWRTFEHFVSIHLNIWPIHAYIHITMKMPEIENRRTCPFLCLMNSFRRKDSQIALLQMNVPNNEITRKTVEKFQSLCLKKLANTHLRRIRTRHVYNNNSNINRTDRIGKWNSNGMRGVFVLHISSVEPLGRHHSLYLQTLIADLLLLLLEQHTNVLHFPGPIQVMAKRLLCSCLSLNNKSKQVNLNWECEKDSRL